MANNTLVMTMPIAKSLSVSTEPIRATVLFSGEAACRADRQSLLVQASDERQQGDGTGALDRKGQGALVLGTGPGYAPRNDLSPFGDEIF
jgi:hypothetical protein